MAPANSPALLTIAGSDPSGGAGIQADLKTCMALGVYGAAAITCLTVQNTLGVRYFEPLKPQLVYDQIRAVLVDLPISHIKIGMVGTIKIADAIAAALHDFSGEVIYDPVLLAGDGHRLFRLRDLPALGGSLLPKITVITPNLPELAALTSLPPAEADKLSDQQLLAAAEQLFAQLPGLQAVVITGGHRNDQGALRDLLIQRSAAGADRLLTASHPRLKSPNLHGTGCTFATALAAWHLRCGSYPEAFRRAAAFTAAAIAAGAGLTMGGGNGPLPHHLLGESREPTAGPFACDDGRFKVILHRPRYRVLNLRRHDYLAELGRTRDGETVENQANFPPADLEVRAADPVYEIPNPLSFRGATYISRSWAEAKAADPASIRITPLSSPSLRQNLEQAAGQAAGPQGEITGEGSKSLPGLLALLPRPLLLTLAASSHDPVELTMLAERAAGFCRRGDGEVSGLLYQKDDGDRTRPLIHDHELYETVANNPRLPDHYKEAMVLRPGAQGGSEIVGEYGKPGGETHIFEYLRRNSYIPWGHYAANLADDAIRYRISDLSLADMRGLRHLYYQRSYLRLAEMLELDPPRRRCNLEPFELEELRGRVLARLRESAPAPLPFSATLWGWNFGYDLSGSGFRLHASHQQIHQQYALIPPPPAFSCGDQITRCVEEYRRATGRGLFADYLAAIAANRRIDGRSGGRQGDRPGGCPEDQESLPENLPESLIVYENRDLMILVPKAQLSQWELQIICKDEVGNILEANAECRAALDYALLLAQQILAALGATLVTSLEYGKRLDNPDNDQRLLYSLLPKLPWSMGAFSEAQHRFICGHYPEDFAAACREQAQKFIGEPPPQCYP